MPVVEREPVSVVTAPLHRADAAPARAADSRRVGPWRWSVVAVLVGLTLLAAVVRSPGLTGPDGRLSKDEAVEALAADGVLRGGLPTMPTGPLRTRAVLSSYLIAGSFAAFGRSDVAARLPSALAGVALVPVVFLLGRALGGTAAGLAAATFTVLAAPLIEWSRNAWPPSIFLVLFSLAAYAAYRGFVERRAGWQLVTACVFVSALFAYEFAVALLGGLGLYLALQLAQRRWGWYAGRRTLLAFGIMLAGLVLYGALARRTGSLADPYGQVKKFVAPSFSLAGAEYYLRVLLVPYTPLLVLALIGLPFLARRRPRGTLYVGGLLAATFLLPSFVIQVQLQARYALAVLPLLAVLAAAGGVRLARLVGREVSSAPLRAVLPTLVLLLVFGTALRPDAVAAARQMGEPPPRQTWLQVMAGQDLRPSDLIVTEGPEVAYFYLGRADYYFRAGEPDRYVYPALDGLRAITTGSLLLHQPGDFEQLVERPNAGRRIWVIGRRDRLRRLTAQIDPLLWPALAASAEQRVETPDGWILLAIWLPLRARP